MSEPDSWKQDYTKLSDFINNHPEVEIEESRFRIPESVRPEFYRLFNRVRTAFVEEKFADPQEAKSLNEEYTKAEEEVIKLLELERISLATQLHRFLHNPIDELVRGLYKPLFDLLKGKVDIEKFEKGTSSHIEASFQGLYHLGYEKWLALSLIKLFESDKLFQVTPREFRSDYDMLVTSVSDTKKEDIPVPKESKCISFDHPLASTFVAPDFIVHSAKVNRYIALRSVIGKARTLAKNASNTREWYPVESVVPESGLTLVYLADKPEEISLVADSKRICRPDLIIECEGGKDWYGKERMEKIKLQHNSLKPILGTYVVSHKPVPEQAYKDLMPEESLAPTLGEERLEQEASKQAGIHILTVGFDQLKLVPIIDIMGETSN